MSDRWRVRECPEHKGLYAEVFSTCHVCFRDLEPVFEVMRVPDLEGPGQARKTDPPTAKAAGEITVKRGTQRWLVLTAIERAGRSGRTAGELVEETEIPYASLTPRIGELKRGRLIEAKGDETRPSQYGVQQEVLVITTIDLATWRAAFDPEDIDADSYPDLPPDLVWE